jgi:hypothetical protein
VEAKKNLLIHQAYGGTGSGLSVLISLPSPKENMRAYGAKSSGFDRHRENRI